MLGEERVPIGRPSLGQLAQLVALESEVVWAVVADCVGGSGTGGEGVWVWHAGLFALHGYRWVGWGWMMMMMYNYVDVVTDADLG